MIENQPEKLNRFASSVNTEVDEKIQLMEKQALEEKAEMLENTENKILEEVFLKIQKAVRDIEGKYRRNIALKEQELRTDILKHRESLSNKIFDAVKDKIISFTDSDKYEAFLEKILKNEDLTDAEIRLSQKDMEKYSKIIQNKTGCHAKYDNDIRLGGVQIVYKSKNIIIDKTLDSLFDEQKERFYSEYHFSEKKS